VRAYLCTPGFEAALEGELQRAGARAQPIAPGVVTAGGGDPDRDPVFARQVLPDAKDVAGTSVRALAEACFAAVENAVDRATGPFTIHALTAADPPPGLGSRAGLVARETLALIGARRRRASRRYQPPEPAPSAADTGRLLVQILALDRARWLVSAAAPRRLPNGALDLAPWPAGAAPVAVDRAPPSRAYQKLEEAFAWMAVAPGPGELVVDLGAAPGGWTATALKRGARVVAVDRAPLAGALARHERVAMVIGNAFTYLPGAPADWLVSDVVAEPHRSLGVVAAWLERDLCRNLVVTVKFKGQSGYAILDEIPARLARFSPAFARVKQLAHNKNEVTVMVRRGP
jgi:23S rRNA (cytidine2498-2'-O)-methyltransferase